MKKIIFSFIVIIIIVFITGCDLWIIGSEKTGYRIEIESQYLYYNDLSYIESMLMDKGYEKMIKIAEKILSLNMN